MLLSRAVTASRLVSALDLAPPAAFFATAAVAAQPRIKNFEVYRWVRENMQILCGFLIEITNFFCKFLKDCFGFKIKNSNVCRWIRRKRRILSDFFTKCELLWNFQEIGTFAEIV